MREIILTKGQYAQVDDDDYDRLVQYRWYTHTNGYAARDEGSVARGKRRTVLMHRFIINAPDGVEVDHINGRKTDNQRENLRLCTHHENMANRPATNGKRFKGVVRRTGHRSLYAEIAGQHLGAFDSEREAALAYDRAARERFGEFARLNFPGAA